MPSPLSRRHFLAASAGVVVTACGKKSSPDVSVKRRSESKALNIILGNQPPTYVAGIEERVAFIVLEGKKPTSNLDIEVGFKAAGGEYGEGVKAVAHRDGMEQRPYYLVRQTFATPGFYQLGINVAGGSAEAALQAVDPASIPTPIPGRAMPAVKTPTVTNPMDVNPICTRSPVCPWHEVGLDAALAEKRPVALYVGTPARCVTKTCGPVLDVLLDVKGPFESKVRFVHLEVYKSLTGEDTIAAIDELKIDTDPWLFLVGADGVVRDRYNGPIDRKEATEGLTRLVS
ncbi:MAG: hypothetical protein H0W70_13565 [Actinobacteria bacterium]|nr:hypothetical protein [Actinomycetota bacterium]